MLKPTRWWSRFKDVTAFWRAPVIAGVVTGVGAWLVWYFTKVPCIMENAAAGLCNPGVLASYINLPALASCLAIGGGFATFAGGYNIIMLNKERQRADDAEARLQAERERNDQEREKRDQERGQREREYEQREREYEREREQQRERYERLMDEFLEERRQANEDRRQFAASQQAMMNTLVEISATLARLAEQQQNGHRANGD